jgi:hypothetical protein
VAFVVVYDASVLYPNTLRDLLIRIAQSGLVQARWTEMILDEMFDRTRALVATAVRDWKVIDFEPLIDSLKLPDPDDHHVLAAAI